MPALLIVDDSVTVRKMIMAALRPLGLAYGEAGSGLEAIEQLALQPYDAVTLDLNMPDMHGLELLHFLRNNSRLKDLPVLVVSTRSDEEMQAAALSAGANGYLAKPFSPPDLLEAVQAIFNQQNLSENAN